jgi:two-component system sensor histidine kinase KdpD
VRYIPSFIVFIFVALVNSFLAKRVRSQADASSNREKYLSALYEFNKVIMSADNIDDAISQATKSIVETFSAKVAIFLPDVSNNLIIKTMVIAENDLSDAELAIAAWVYQNGQVAGKNTYTLSSSEWYYLPLRANNKVLGVLGIKEKQAKTNLTYEQNRLLESLANTLALVISKAELTI